MRIVELNHASGEERALITRPLGERTTRGDFAFAPHVVALALTDEKGIDGGLLAAIYWDWMRIEVLAVPGRLRGKGLGRELMAKAEAEARRHGCVGIWVDAYSFQSPDFYVRMGFAPFGRLPDYPKGEARIFLAKRLDAGPDMGGPDMGPDRATSERDILR